MNKKIIQRVVLTLALVLTCSAYVPVAFAAPNVENHGTNTDVNVKSTGTNTDVNVGKPNTGSPSLLSNGVEKPIQALNNSLSEEKTGLNSFDGRFHPLSAVDPGADVITSIIYTVIDFLKYFLGTIATLMAVIQGLKLVTAGKKIDEVQPKATTTLKLMVYGFVIVMIADQLVHAFYGETGSCAASVANVKDCAEEGDKIIKGIYDFILSILATLAIFSIALAGFRMVTAAGNEDTVTTSKKRIGIAIVGLIVAGIGEYVVKGVVFPDNGSQGIDYDAAQKLVISFTNYISSFIGTGAFIMLFYGGYIYAASFGDDERVGKAKNIIKSALIGIIIAAAAFAIVRTVTSFQARTDLNLPSSIPGVSSSK